jgi:hypothetical protein
MTYPWRQGAYQHHRELDAGGRRTGNPAWYRLKYGSPITQWREATVACDPIEGDEIGAPLTCTVDGLRYPTDYQFRLMSFRVENGAWVDARYSNMIAGTPNP